ncbi:DNA-dependent protein kinase catalytic subunit-like isoform X3 [Periplaneta americana]|uniref:DNA-dependent protein kinase catalytic subunit-like isoform X3 n=1 Tax=Periplaneta americana TaxID=6978 RepID=UPI0037E8C185
MGELESYIEVLNRSVSENYPSRYTDAKSNVLNIKTYFEEDKVTRTELDEAFTVLFDKRTGILQFIQKAIKQDGFVEAVKESFILLKLWIDNSKTRISRYILQIKELCKTCIRLDKKADEKEKALEVIQSILEKGPWNDDLNVNELFNRLISPFPSNQYKTMPGKVTQKHLHILGIIVRRYPEYVEEKDRNLLLRIYLSNLGSQKYDGSTIKYQVVVGCLNGLTEYLYVFPLNTKENEATCKKVYNYMKEVSLKHKEMRVAPRAALELIQAHGCQFTQFLYEEYKFWHEFLLKWVNTTGEDHKVGVAALDMFYGLMADTLKEKPAKIGSSVFLYFINDFRKKMLSQDTSSQDMKLVIKSFGLFSGPCRIYMKPQDVAYMFTVVVQRAEQVYFKEEELTSEDLQNLHDYIESLSSIMMQLEGLTNEQLGALQSLTVMLIDNFPKLPKYFHWLANRALIVTLCNLADSGGTALGDFLSNVVYQGVIRSCKDQIAIDVELQKEKADGGNVITYRDYLPIWKALLTPQSFEKRSTSLANTQMIVTKVYDELITTLLVLVKKLDLTTRKKVNSDVLAASSSVKEDKDDIPVLDPESGLEANNCKDFQVFINLVDLMRDILLSVDSSRFEKWVHSFCYEVISESSRKPLVSGFYKLLTVALQLCDTMDFFGEYESVGNQPSDLAACYSLLCRFLQELMVRLQQYKNDLQVACLQTVIAAPVALIVPLLPHAAPAFEAIFRVGRSLLSLAHLGLSALEKWNGALPSHLMKPLLIQVLPYLDPFLRSKDQSSGEDVYIDTELMALKGRGRSNYSKTRRVTKKRIVECSDSELSQLQHHIISFLGQLDSATCLALRDPQQDEQDTQPWAVCLQQPLIFPLPFKDMKLNVHLEKMIPRLVELALTSSDRYTRFTACELLHAVIMFMLGSSWGAHAANPDMYSKLFEKLSLPLLKLGCDPDHAVQRLYSLLDLQLVHWYSSKFKLRSKETEALIRALMDGITHPTDTALRDFSAKCLHEFVVWSVKQLSSSELEHSPVNIKAIMKQIYSFCLHPCPSKRLGAALVLNSVYKVLREEESIVNQFWLELLYHMVVNLSLAEETDSIPGSQEQVVTALQHIERVLKEKASLFNKEHKKRRKPPEFEGILLKDAVSWLLLKCGAVQTECRHKCMELVYVLAPLLPGFKSGTDFVSSYASTHSWKALISVCEGSKENRTGITVTPTLIHIKSGATLSHVVQWLQMLLASLDCYVWLFGTGLVTPSALLGDASQASVFEAAVYFIHHVSQQNASSVIQLMDVNAEREPTPWEAENFNRVKCSVLVRLLDFVSIILQSEEPQCLPTSLLSQQLWYLVVMCVLHPSQLGFDLRSTEVLDGLPKNLTEFLKILQKSLPSSPRAELKSELRKNVTSVQTDVLKNLRDCLKNDKVTLEQKQFLQGLQILHRCDMLKDIIGGAPNQCEHDGEQIVKDLFSSLVEGHGDVKRAVLFQPRALVYAESLLKFAFLLTEQVAAVLSCIKERAIIQNPATHLPVSHGDYFLVTFKSAVLDHLLDHSENTMNRLLVDLSKDNVQWMLRILTELLHYLAKSKKNKQKESITSALEAGIVNYWSRLCGLADSNSELVYQLLGLTASLARVMPQPVGWLIKQEVLRKWVITQLTSQQLQLHHKLRALDLLVCLTGPDEDTNNQLQSALKQLREQHFPQLSSELRPGSCEYSSFVSAFRKILRGLEASGSRVILHSIVAMVASEPKHVCEDTIQQSLLIFMKRLNIENQVKAIEVVFQIFMDQQYDPNVRLGCAQRFVQPLLLAARQNAAREFYKGSIQSLITILSEKLDVRGGLRVEHQMVGRIGAWNIIGPLFVQIETSELESKECVITLAAFPSAATGKELITDLTSRAYKYRTDILSDNLMRDAQVVELFRQSQCAAFNTLAVLISTVKNDIKFFTVFLFSESKTKEVPWEKLVDCRKEYSLTLDWEEVPVRRKQLVNIRRQARDERREVRGFASQSVRYIPSASQYLFDSTLNEDVTLFDFSTSIVRTDNPTAPSSNQKLLEEQFGAEGMEVSLELDDLNKHECMATLCGLIQHMVDEGISPAPPSDNKDAPPPAWLESLRKCLNDSSRPRNIRLFLLKLLLNVESRVRPYALSLLNSVLKAIDDGVLGMSPNYLLADTVAMVVEWCSKVTSLSERCDRHLVSQLLHLLISNVQHQRRVVFMHNLELIRTVIELFKPNFDLPMQLLYDMIMKQDRKDPTLSEPGIQVAAIVLANRLEPWSSTGKLSFLNAVLRNLDNEKQGVFQAAAEVAGMALKLLDINSSGMLEGADAEFQSQLINKLNTLKNKTKDKFLICLFAVQEHYPRIVDSFINHVLFNLPRMYGMFRIMSLKIVYSRLEILEDEMYIELKSKDLLKILNDRDPDQQNLALNIVDKMVPHLKSEQLEEIVSVLCKFEAHRSHECRSMMYKILMWIYDHCQDIGGLLIEQTKSTLLRGLRDDHPALQDTIFSYWNNDARYRDSTTTDQLLFILNDLYSPTTEHHFLSYSTQLLLEATVGTPDYKQKMFKDPLSKCHFEDFKMFLSWRAQHATIAPMFADTLASQLMQSQSMSDMSGGPLLRATQASLAFQPTLAQSGSSVSSLPTFSMSSSALFTVGSYGGTFKKSYKMGPDFGRNRLQPNPESSDEVDSAASYSTPNLRRRFLRNKYQERIFHASREVKRSARREELERERIRRREANIASFRDYRSGDFPDIEIPYSAVIRPMQELAKRDAAIARQLFVSLFDSLLEELRDDKNTVTQQVQTALENILRNTKDCSSMLMGTVLEIALKHVRYIVLEAEEVAAVSKASGLMALGSLLIEEMLIARDSNIEAGPSKRARTIEPSGEEDLWLALVDLYKSIDEWDVVRGIFHKYLGCSENIQKAVEAEASGHWNDAREKYEAALSSMGEETFLSDNYLEALYKCLGHMSDWDELNVQVRRQVDNDLNQLWTDTWLQVNLLPHLLSSEVQIMIDKGTDGNRGKFLQQIDEWLTDKDKSTYLSNHHSEELAAIYTIQGNTDRAWQQVERSVISFLNTWAELHPLSTKLRAKQLLDLQKFAELRSCLKFAKIGEQLERESQAKELLKRWNNNIPSEFDSLLHWDFRTMYRKKFSSQVQQILENSDIANVISHTELAMVDSALCQENFSVARKYLRRTKEKLVKYGRDMGLQWNLVYSKAIWLQGQLVKTSDKKLEFSLRSWDALDKVLADQNLMQWPMLHVETLRHVSVMVTGILQQLEDSGEEMNFTPESIQTLVKKINAPDCSQNQLSQHLKQHGLTSLKRAAELVTRENISRDNAVDQAIAKAYLEVAKYCRACNSRSHENDFGTDIVTSVLRAMRYGSKDARQLFPCLLQLPGLPSQLSEVFLKESKEVPAWMFLGWVNQLLACLDTPVGPVLYDLVLSLAQTYPQALIYAFPLSREKYNLERRETRLKDLVYQLESILFSNPLVDTFLRAFSCLALPCNMLYYFVVKLTKSLNVGKPNFNVVSQLFDTMMEEIFPDTRKRVHGSAFESVKTFQKQLEKMKPNVKSRDKSLKDLESIKSDLEKMMRKIKASQQLKDYSPWLSEFQAGSHGCVELEIPGQYTGESKPLLQHHIKIVGFGQNVVPLESLRSPLRITVLGSDAKEHRYLVKYGEDLRQDQRLEQLFNLMNKILNQDPNCRHRRLSITTYQVVPFTSFVGIIQWVDGTQGAKDLILSVLSQDEKNDYEGASEKHWEWISKSVRKKSANFREMYGGAYMKYSRGDTIAEFRKKVNMVPWDVMRRVLRRLSTSWESYFSLRQEFACSYAVLCIAHWLLGIGDRHLSNFLVSLRDGRCVGIDFGYAFGMATQFLPVPELMPFRLTPHIVALLQPLEETGLFRETMIHCLRALRNNHDMLLATMEVFVQEPTMDWLDLASKHETLTKDSHEEGTQEWYPKQKLDLARQKLAGSNPVFITTKELRAGFSNTEFLPKLLEAVRGSDESIRSKLPSHNLSPENQVDCLLDQAMDYNILGKTWAGWDPWV